MKFARWTGVVTTDDWSMVCTYGPHVRTATPRDYEPYQRTFDLFLKNIKNTRRPGVVVSEPPIFPEVRDGTVAAFFNNGGGSEGRFLQATTGEYNQNASEDGQLGLVHLERTLAEELEWLRVQYGFSKTDLDDTGFFLLGRRVNTVLARFQDERIAQEAVEGILNSELLPMYEQVEAALEWQRGKTPIQSLNEHIDRIYGELPARDRPKIDLHDAPYWRALTMPWREPKIANDRLPGVLHDLGTKLMFSRAPTVVGRLFTDYIEHTDVLITYGPEHRQLQLELLIEGLEQRGLDPAVYVLEGKGQVRIDLLRSRMESGQGLASALQSGDYAPVNLDDLNRDKRFALPVNASAGLCRSD